MHTPREAETRQTFPEFGSIPETCFSSYWDLNFIAKDPSGGKVSLAQVDWYCLEKAFKFGSTHLGDIQWRVRYADKYEFLVAEGPNLFHSNTDWPYLIPFMSAAEDTANDIAYR